MMAKSKMGNATINTLASEGMILVSLMNILFTYCGFLVVLTRNIYETTNGLHFGFVSISWCQYVGVITPRSPLIRFKGLQIKASVVSYCGFEAQTYTYHSLSGRQVPLWSFYVRVRADSLLGDDGNCRYFGDQTGPEHVLVENLKAGSSQLNICC
ncbi:hypothetical protein V8F20_003199 [Naviculisporaceae sp. PSN 640]